MIVVKYAEFAQSYHAHARCSGVTRPTLARRRAITRARITQGSDHRRMTTSPLNVLRRKSVLPPPLSDPRKFLLLLELIVTGRSLLKLPLKLSKVRSPLAVSGRRRVTSPLNVSTFTLSPSFKPVA